MEMTQKNLKKENAQIDQDLKQSLDYSVVVPISERHDELKELYHLYSEQLKSAGYRFEFIFVLDGRQQEAEQALIALKKEVPDIKVICLNRAFGEATLLSIGFEYAKGKLIITLSPYFQVEPSELSKVLQALEAGENDLVITRRYPRIDSAFNQLQSFVFHKITKILTGSKYKDISCGLRVLRPDVAKEVHLYGDLHRFFPLLAFQRGFKVVEIPVKQSPHDAKSRINSPGAYLRRLLDILTLFFLFKFTKKPLRFFGLIGSFLSGAGALTLGYLTLYRLLGFGGIAGRPLLILGVLLVVLGVQLFSIGLLGEIIIFTHSSETKDYQIKKILR